MEDDWEDVGCEDLPWADPQIRVEYEAALGRLILAHNEVDFLLGKSLRRVVERIAPDGSLDKFATGTFAQRLNNLNLFQQAARSHGPVMVDVTNLRKLNTILNHLAHGHFDQNPYDGSFAIRGDGRRHDKNRPDYSTASLNEATDALKAIASILFAH